MTVSAKEQLHPLIRWRLSWENREMAGRLMRPGMVRLLSRLLGSVLR